MTKPRSEEVMARHNEKVQGWIEAGERYLNEPIKLRPLLPITRRVGVPFNAKAIRNAVGPTEFLREVLALPDLNVHVEAKALLEALDNMPGWTRLEGRHRHRGIVTVLYVRDGTNGRPTPLPITAEAPRDLGRFNCAGDYLWATTKIPAEAMMPTPSKRRRFM